MSAKTKRGFYTSQSEDVRKTKDGNSGVPMKESLESLNETRKLILKQLEDVNRIEAGFKSKPKKNRPLSALVKPSAAHGTCSKYLFAQRLKQELQGELAECQKKILEVGGQLETIKGIDLIRFSNKQHQTAVVKTASRRHMTSARDLYTDMQRERSKSESSAVSALEEQKQMLASSQEAEERITKLTETMMEYKAIMEQKKNELERKIEELTRENQVIKEKLEELADEYETELHELKEKNVETLQELYTDLKSVEEVNDNLNEELERERLRRKSVNEQLEISKQLIALLEKGAGFSSDDDYEDDEE